MSDQGALSELRERVGRLEVTQNYQNSQISANKEQLERLSTRSTDHERRIANIEQLVKVMYTTTKWGLASVGTMVLEAMTGAIRSALKFLAVGGSG